MDEDGNSLSLFSDQSNRTLPTSNTPSTTISAADFTVPATFGFADVLELGEALAVPLEAPPKLDCCWLVLAGLLVEAVAVVVAVAAAALPVIGPGPMLPLGV